MLLWSQKLQGERRAAGEHREKRQRAGWIVAKATLRLTDFPFAEKMQLSELIPSPEWDV